MQAMKAIKGIFLSVTILLTACFDSNVKLATVKTGEYTVYTQTLTASCNGFVETDGGGAVIERGICYMRGQGTPTVSNTCVSAGSGKGSFSATLTNLQKGEIYSYRAYATNSKGTAYGDVAAFKVDENSIVDPVNPGDNPSDNPGDNNQNVNEALKPIIGKYVMTCKEGDMYMYVVRAPRSWQGIRIYPNAEYGENGVTVEGLFEGNANYAACGIYDASKKTLTLYEGTTSGREFQYSMNGYDDNGNYGLHTYNVIAKFQPYDYSVCEDCGDILSGVSVPKDKTSQVVFELTAANTLTLGLIPNSERYQIFRFLLYDGENYRTWTNHMDEVVLTRLSGSY